MLADRVINDQIGIDLRKLYIQGDVENNARGWFDLPYEMRRCVFLDEEGMCKVYEDRPSVCRTNNAFNDPVDCDTSDGVEKPLRLLNTDKADIAMIASYEVAGEGGTLPLLLWKALEQYRAEINFEDKKIEEPNTNKLRSLKKNLFKIFEV